MVEADRLAEEARTAFKVVEVNHKLCVNRASTVATRSRAAASAANIARRANRMARDVILGARRNIRKYGHEMDALEIQSFREDGCSYTATADAKREVAAVARESHRRSVVLFDMADARFKKAQSLANELELDAQKARDDVLEWSARYSMEQEEEERTGSRRWRGFTLLRHVAMAIEEKEEKDEDEQDEEDGEEEDEIYGRKRGCRRKRSSEEEDEADIPPVVRKRRRGGGE